jgi:peptidyl-prolyl cis-trans isomerase C
MKLLAATAASLVIVAWAGTSMLARAEPAGDAAQADAVVARVGGQVITAREVERRLAQVPQFQLHTFGQTPEEIRKSFVQSVLARELLLSQGASARKLDTRADVQDRVRGVLRNALLQRLQAEVAADTPVTEEEVRAHYEANRDRFSSPPRVALWRILVATRDEAAAILDDLKKELSPQRWSAIASERSLDKTTNMRGGNLGFVSPDGATAEAAVKVDARLLEAAARVKDGELVPEPVPEGDRFAVVWRRQGMKAVNRTLEQEAPSIRQALARTKAEARVKELLAQLRAKDLSEHAPELADLIDVSPVGDLQPRRRPGALPSARRPSTPAPEGAPRGATPR